MSTLVTDLVTRKTAPELMIFTVSFFYLSR